ncbi:hypothetical protein LTR91_026558 [Friedmanniomyces endolithicus]|uniref:DUF7707 domain-containing protein n=1 Tax=Friedmanniomyces endolithicus TaxID=329885 RepID=A0AAN6J0M3_9PEZI|nr:hypothetical protein LTS09_003903 [Friedmanniomyces endolithicus]KAK0271403.1 hypothetical protein LTR35_013441 [Friedmanniomyces endolithicus]KAK0280527.1 hypothetical protein LTS00_012956 [Friedmanniomyces endolithicus]KAK0304807.1 hypothetical protein LTR82_017062 [Friedmanniomyces endolithicus]KAK0307162.1 hypothetical protein LTR01_005808 [Friedmanniomyces endolithicus]
MFYSTLLIAATALTGFVSAQNYTTSGPINITASSVPYDTRLAWCRAQQNSCPMLCGGQASPNSCDSNTLTYTCTCSNGNQPNISNYDQTIPSFVCAQWKIDCVAAHPNDLTGQTGCLSLVCGSQNASSGSTASSSSASGSGTASSTASSTGGAAAGASSTGASSAAASSTGGAAATSSSGSGATSAASSAAAASTSKSAAMNVAMNYGTGILATAMLAFFGLAL